MRIHVKLSLVVCGESVYSDLYIVWSDIEVLGNTLDKLQHLVKVGRSHTARGVQKEDDISLCPTV